MEAMAHPQDAFRLLLGLQRFNLLANVETLLQGPAETSCAGGKPYCGVGGYIEAPLVVQYRCIQVRSAALEPILSQLYVSETV